MQTPGGLEHTSRRELAARTRAPAPLTLPPPAAVARESPSGRQRRRLPSLESRLGVPQEAGAGGSQRAAQRAAETPSGWVRAGGGAPRRRRHGSFKAEYSGPSCGPRAFRARGSHVASHVRLLLEPYPRGWTGPGEVARACDGTSRAVPRSLAGLGARGRRWSQAAREGAQAWILLVLGGVRAPHTAAWRDALMWPRGCLSAFLSRRGQVPKLGGVSGCRWVRVASGSDLRFGGAATGRWAGRADRLFHWGLDATRGKAHACLGCLGQGDPGQEKASLVGSSVNCSGLFHPRVLLCGSSLTRR